MVVDVKNTSIVVPEGNTISVVEMGEHFFLWHTSNSLINICSTVHKCISNVIQQLFAARKSAGQNTETRLTDLRSAGSKIAFTITFCLTP